MSLGNVSRHVPSSTFEIALRRCTEELSPEQKAEFQVTTIEDLRNVIELIQSSREPSGRQRDVRGVYKFLEGMDAYGKVIESFMSCTPFMGYAWVSRLMLAGEIAS